MRINVWFRQGGYLFLARTARERARLEKNVGVQNRCGVPSRMLTPGEALERGADYLVVGREVTTAADPRAAAARLAAEAGG